MWLSCDRCRGDTRIEHDRRHFGFLCDLMHLCTVHTQADTQAKTPTSMRNASPHGITDNVAQMSSTTKSTLPRPAIAPPRPTVNGGSSSRFAFGMGPFRVLVTRVSHATTRPHNHAMLDWWCLGVCHEQAAPHTPGERRLSDVSEPGDTWCRYRYTLLRARARSDSEPRRRDLPGLRCPRPCHVVAQNPLPLCPLGARTASRPESSRHRGRAPPAWKRDDRPSRRDDRWRRRWLLPTLRLSERRRHY